MKDVWDDADKYIHLSSESFSEFIIRKFSDRDLDPFVIANPNFEIHVLFPTGFIAGVSERLIWKLTSPGRAISRILWEQEPVKRDPTRPAL